MNVSSGIPVTRMTMQSRAVRALLPMAYRIVRHRFSVIRGGSAARAAVPDTRGYDRRVALRRGRGARWLFPDTFSQCQVENPRSKRCCYL